VKYSENMESLSDRFMHLTNYSINKLSNQYCANEDASSCKGHKWTLKTLWQYLEKVEKVDVGALQKHLTDLVIKTIISGESHIQVCIGIYSFLWLFFQRILEREMKSFFWYSFYTEGQINDSILFHHPEAYRGFVYKASHIGPTTNMYNI